jgi:hypothetical protein
MLSSISSSLLLWLCVWFALTVRACHARQERTPVYTRENGQRNGLDGKGSIEDGKRAACPTRFLVTATPGIFIRCLSGWFVPHIFAKLHCTQDYDSPADLDLLRARRSRASATVSHAMAEEYASTPPKANRNGAAKTIRGKRRP